MSVLIYSLPPAVYYRKSTARRPQNGRSCGPKGFATVTANHDYLGFYYGVSSLYTTDMAIMLSYIRSYCLKYVL